MIEVKLVKGSPPKKWKMEFYKDGKKIKTTSFGAYGMSDYTIHKDLKRKALYLARHKKRENWNDFYSAGSLSRWILWNKTTLNSSLLSYLKKFKLKIKK
tara:strand:- start:327 stop:623 length:297 start_codon:yes stop_codon:yes gene_type:complete